MLPDGVQGRNLAGAPPESIRAHYDTGNTFFAGWLDSGMIYSAGCWRGKGRCARTLEEAQVWKLDWHLDAAGIKSGSRLLDVGCGWGALLSRAVAEYGAKAAIGLTPAAEQVRWIETHCDRPEISIVPTLWQTANFKTRFDAIVSIGALEHFARPGITQCEKRETYKGFFDFCNRHLVENGGLSLQFIGWMDVPPADETRNLPAFLFPDSNLPRVHEVLAASNKHFHIMRLENSPEDYARTLGAWLARMQTNRQALIQMHGKDVVRAYVHAFRRFVLGFESGSLGLYRLSMRRKAS